MENRKSLKVFKKWRRKIRLPKNYQIKNIKKNLFLKHIQKYELKKSQKSLKKIKMKIKLLNMKPFFVISIINWLILDILHFNLLIFLGFKGLKRNIGNDLKSSKKV